ncbi:MAG: glycosyltransferase family 39 protein [Solirubrobacteraceae bacterium]
MTTASLRLPSFARLPPPGRGVIVAAVLAVVVFAAAALRVEAADGRPGHASADERAYVRLASDLRATGTYGGPSMAHPLHWAPGAPVLFAVADALSGHPAGGLIDTRAARRAQAVVGALTVGAAFALAALIADAWAGVVAAVAVAFYPPMIAATTQLTSEPLGALALTAALAAVAWAWSRGRAAGFAAAGAAVGLACLVRADVLLAALVLAPAVGLLHAQRSTWRAGVVAGCATLLGVLAIVAPWSAFASRRDRAFVPITDGGPATLFVGTYLPGHGTIFGLKHALAREAMGVHPSIRHKALFRLPEKVFLDAVAARHPHLSRDAAISAELRRNLRVYLLGHPVAFARMLAAKTWRMWAFPFRGTFRRVGATTIWLHRVLVALALAGLVAGLVRRRSAILGLAALTLGVTAAVDIAFVAEARHAFRLMPALLAAGAGAWALLAGGARASRRPPDD